MHFPHFKPHVYQCQIFSCLLKSQPLAVEGGKGQVSRSEMPALPETSSGASGHKRRGGQTAAVLHSTSCTPTGGSEEGTALFDSRDSGACGKVAEWKMGAGPQCVPRKEEMMDLTEEQRQGQCAFLQHYFVGADKGIRKRCAQQLSEKEVGKAPRHQAKSRKTDVVCTIQHVSTGVFDLTKNQINCLDGDKWLNDEV